MPHLCDKYQNYIFLFYKQFLREPKLGWNKELFSDETMFRHRTVRSEILTSVRLNTRAKVLAVALAETVRRELCFRFISVSSAMADAEISMKCRMHGKFFCEDDAEIRIARALPGFALTPRFEKTNVVQNLDQIIDMP